MCPRLMCPERKVLDVPSLGECVPWTMRPLDDTSLGRCIPWTMRPLDDASFDVLPLAAFRDFAFGDTPVGDVTTLHRL